MDSVDRRAVTPRKSRWTHTFAKVLHMNRAVTGVSSKSHDKVKQDRISQDSKSFEEEDGDEEKLRHRMVMEAFLAKLFASIATMKAAYAQMQFSQSPYDAGGIQAADQRVVLELKNLSQLKQCYRKNQLDESSPEKTQLVAELQEQKSLLKTYEMMGKKLDSQLKLRESEITFLKEKLKEINRENKLIERRLNSSGLLSVPSHLHLSSLCPDHFISALSQTIKSVRQFIRWMMNEMELAGWDLDLAAEAIEPGVDYLDLNHRYFAFESFVFKEMFDGFNFPNFSLPNESLPEQQKQRHFFFDRFTELKPVKTREYLARKPKSMFAGFCSTKYFRLVHPKMESSLFGNFNQRNLLNAGEFPETNFFTSFAEMAKRVWLLHCLALSFEPQVSIFQVGKRSRFSEVYMESVSKEAFMLTKTEPSVAFTVVPGFKIGKTIVQCQVYLS
ncbi:hypothetical protein Acr_23g0007740 [Actinidia rufa]|uniref:DUF641 domain-containing protein n=1 Tax=Actinidia rufa TaxID=165716 RepID=A0A7J0GNM3_9ERIC|nr:hypothetical protein Acr_23g0007740 [Actinidia rufa]